VEATGVAEALMSSMELQLVVDVMTLGTVEDGDSEEVSEKECDILSDCWCCDEVASEAAVEADCAALGAERGDESSL